MIQIYIVVISGEESSFEMTEDGLVGQGDLGLGLTKEQIEEILGKLDVEKGQYFEDPEFPCGPSALFYRFTLHF